MLNKILFLLIITLSRNVSYNEFGGDIMKEKIILTTVEEIKIFSDPFRYKILMAFYKMKQPATVKEIAVAINQVPANVYYHVKKLEKTGILKLIYTKQIKGIIAKYYEPTAITFNIDLHSELADPSKKLLLAESQLMLAQLYDDSKYIFLEHLSYESQIKEKTKGIITMDYLYLTEDEAMEFNNYIQNFMDKHQIKNKNIDNLKKFHCFFSSVLIKNT
jgi:DNA-binding transcriptional ArsR family regulator